MNITILDADYQALERQLALELVAARRENVVLCRRVQELEAENGQLRAAVAAPVPDAPKRRTR